MSVNGIDVPPHLSPSGTNRSVDTECDRVQRNPQLALHSGESRYSGETDHDLVGDELDRPAHQPDQLRPTRANGAG